MLSKIVLFPYLEKFYIKLICLKCTIKRQQFLFYKRLTFYLWPYLFISTFHKNININRGV